ncbi:TPA: hypothetical protein ON086_003027 [Klebsiella aerogenes]|nr:hypothetical protein [Klebsiella aerogenes]
MKVNIFLIPDSFNFGKDIEEILSDVNIFNILKDKMASDFVTFSLCSDFYNKIAPELYTASMDSGWAMSKFYDGINNVNTEEIDSVDTLVLANNDNPEYFERWIGIYTPIDINLSQLKEEAKVKCENSLVEFCTNTLAKNKREHSEYSFDIQQIYKNLIFLENPQHDKYKTFDSIRKMDGGYRNFQGAISKFLCFANSYNIIPHNSQTNIDNMCAFLDFPVTPEGKGKNKRKIKALKRDFLIDGVVYENVNCEYHYKLERYDDSNGKGTYYFNRIYFGFFNRIDPENPKISIAHIGEHL